MFDRRQWIALILISLCLWVAATLYIRWLPASFLNPLQGALGFLASLPMAWLSVILVRQVAKLRPQQLLAGVSVVGAVAMMTDGVVLRWWPLAYGTGDTVVRLGAAWLLWGYGLSLAVALGMSATALRAR